MKNSEKFEIIIMIVLFIIFLIIMGLKFIITLLVCSICAIYILCNLYVLAYFPSEKDRYELRSEIEIQRECEEYIKNANWRLITITYWWCRFMYYLDYQLNNKAQNEENK